MQLLTDRTIINTGQSGMDQIHADKILDTTSNEIVTPNSYENSLKAFLAWQIYKVDEVERVYCRRENNVFFVWTVIDQLDYGVRKKIYEKQKDIIRFFDREMFDFYIVARKGRSPDSIISGVEEIPRIDPS